MRDRFPLLLISGLLLVGVLGASILRNSARGDFAGPLSTYRSDAKGARALYLLAEESGLPVVREKKDLELIDKDASLVLLGVRAQPAEEGQRPASASPDGGTPEPDGGTAAREEDEVGSLSELLHAERVTTAEREKLMEQVMAGHTLVYVPPAPEDDALLAAVDLSVVATAPSEPRLRTLVPATPTPYTLGVERVEAEVAGHLRIQGRGVPLLVDERTGDVVAAVVPYGRGQVVVVSAPELAMNAALARADNARFWLSLLSAAAGKDRLLVDEHHHGFRDERSIASFAARYGLHFAIAQLLFGLCLWAGSLKRFGRPRAPPAEARVGGADVLSAAGRLYRAGRHYAYAAQLLADGLSQELASPAGLPLRARPEEVEAGLRSRGRADLAAGLADVRAQAQTATSEHDVLKTAKTAARVRLLLKPRTSQRPPNPRS